MELQPGFDLGPLNTLALPATARYFVRARSERDIEQAASHARRTDTGLFVLGAGSNILISPQIDALVLQPDIRGLAIDEVGHDKVHVRGGAGENWHALVRKMLDRGLYGLENLAWIPGNLGAAPVQNIGAYGVELQQFLVRVRAFDLHSMAWVELGRDDCCFNYRDSLFRSVASGRYVISAVTLALSRRPRVEVSYGALQEELERSGIVEATPGDVFDAVVRVRRRKLPDPDELPNAGSFFKNPLVDAAYHRRLARQFPGLVAYPQGAGRVKLAAAWLIEQAGFKGRTMGGVGMHDKQALVLVNYGGADAAAVLAYAARVQAGVRRHFGVELEREPLWVQADGRCA